MHLVDGEYDLRNCDQEPIHIPGSVQPHGVLLALSEPNLSIEMVSRSAQEILGREVEKLIRLPLDEVLEDESVRRIRGTLSLSDPASRSPLPLRSHGGKNFDGAVHRSDGLVLLELEPMIEAPRQAVELPQTLSRVASELRATTGVSELAQLAATRVRDLAGYDRALVYRFDSEENGEVIGESRDSRLPVYLGLHYPAADIPPQARRLYRENTLRIIVDVGYEPSELEPGTNPLTGKPLDLSRSVLRSVSPFHREYLRNMDVRATLAVSLLVDGKLWGLLVCHHHAPKHVRYEVRATCEVIGSLLSQRVAELQRAEAVGRVSRIREVGAQLLREGCRVDQEDVRTTRALEVCLDELQASALFVQSDGVRLAVGEPVAPEAIDRLLAHLDAIEVSSTFATDHLAALGDHARALRARFSGLLAARLSQKGSWLVVLRPERLVEVTWGASKDKKISVTGGVVRLSPEGSFGLWKETVRHRSRAWSTTDHRVADEMQSTLRSMEAVRLGELALRAREFQQVAEAKDDFLAQLSHELRTPLNTMLGWADLLLSGSAALDAQTRRGIEVVQRNARVQARLVEDLLDVSCIVRGSLRLELSPHAVAPILHAALESVESPAAAKTIEIQTVVDPATGPVNADPVRLQQVFWNLLSNAVKFTPKGGRVRVTLQERHSSVLLDVENTGTGIQADLLPHVFDRFTQGQGGSRSSIGLGLGLAIAKGITELHGGRITARNTTVGACFSVELPVVACQESPQSEPSPLMLHEFAGVAPDLLSNATVLLVEDESEALEVIGEMLRSAGATIIACSSAEEALKSDKDGVDVLVSDLGLPELNGFELIRALRNSGFSAPAVALTAYSSRKHFFGALKAGFSMYLSKPVDREQLLVAVASVLGKYGGGSQ